MQDITVRYAEEADANEIHRMGAQTNDFAVSDAIRFYEEKEIIEWVRNRNGNIFVVAEVDNCLVGLAFCKIISSHWAMIDNFYVLPDFRGKGTGSKISDFLENELRKYDISYVTVLVKPENEITIKFLTEKGFENRDKYIWFDKFI